MTPPNADEDFDLERELHAALGRVEPRRDFSGVDYARRVPTLWTRSRAMLAMAAALLIAVLVPLGVVRHRAEERRALEARAQLYTALRITETKLIKTRQMVARGLNRRHGL